MLGISTCWSENRSLSGVEIIKEILELGLDGVELEYRITHPIYQQMKPLLKKTIKVLSIHNYFPKPKEFSELKAGGDLFLLSSVDKDERTRAIHYTIRTLEHACDLEVTPVILHLGHVDMPNPFAGIKRYFTDGKRDHEGCVAFIKEQSMTRMNKIPKHLDAVLFSLERLNREAEKKGIMLCVENRYHLHEIPDFQEIGVIMDEFRGGNIRYWHDVGHAAAQERMGLCRQKDLLEAYSNVMMGAHIHDIKGLNDHLPPGKGDLDYRELTPHIQSDTLKILEIDSNVPRGELEDGIQFVQRELGWR